MSVNYSQILTINFVGSEWSIVGDDYDSLQWYSQSAKPTQQELDSFWVSTQETIAKENCKKEASAILYETDWTTIPDISDSTQTPYLINQAEFISWRSQIRALAVNPVASPVFPPKPNEVWG